MSFINPIFLFGLLAVALPVLFHLVRRVRARQVQFSSLMFLQMTPRQIVRRRRIKDWLLMAMRSLLFGLLALAFARPFIPEDRIPFGSDREDESVVLLLDRSYSMQYDDRFEEARSRAVAQLDGLQGDDQLAVIAFADQAEQLSSFESEAAVHRDILERVVQPTNRRTDFYAAFRLAESVIQEARHDRVRVVLISDLQRNGWTGAFENWKMAQGIQVDFESVGEAAIVNRYVEAFEQNNRRVSGRVVNLFNARVRTQGDPSDHQVRLQVDGTPDAELLVSGRSGARASFQKEAPREGVLQGQVAVAADALPVDDAYYFTYSVEGRPRILSVDSGFRERASDSYFLQRAFDQGESSRFAIQAIPPNQLGNNTLLDARIVFLSDINRLSAGQYQALLSYAESGGMIVVAPGNRSGDAAFGQQLTQLGVGRANGVVRPRSSQGYDAIIGTVDMRHPVFSVFAGSGSGAVFHPRFRQFVRVTPDSSATVLARFDSEDPMLVERIYGEGRILAFTSTFNAAWGDFPVNEMFVPFVYQLAGYALSAQDEKRQFLVGDPVRLTGTPGETLDVRTPDGQNIKVELDGSGTGFFRETEWPGHYAAGGRNGAFIFSVNVDPRESELDFHDVEEAHGAVVPPPEDVATTAEMAAAQTVEDEEKQQKGWRFVILLAVALFTAETILANRKRAGVGG